MNRHPYFRRRPAQTAFETKVQAVSACQVILCNAVSHKLFCVNALSHPTPLRARQIPLFSKTPRRRAILWSGNRAVQTVVPAPPREFGYYPYVAELEEFGADSSRAIGEQNAHALSGTTGAAAFGAQNLMATTKQLTDVGDHVLPMGIFQRRLLSYYSNPTGRNGRELI
jgi:hypothetical protein